MPDIKLNIPENSRFSSSLNEIDLAMREIFLKEMRIADPRDKTRNQSAICTEPTDNWLWERDRIFQVDEMTTEDIFETWLLRNSNNNKNIDVTYPLLAYKQNDIKDVFWGTGNRYRQWIIETPPINSRIEAGDPVIIKGDIYNKFFGTKATVKERVGDEYILYYRDTTKIITDDKNNPILFTEDYLVQLGNKSPISYKAKAMTGTYSAVILVDNRDEAQYIRDHFILRCNDANIWFTYQSPTVDNTYNQIYTVFEIPVLERYPSATERLKGKGYIYGVGIDVNIWGALTDTPLPMEAITMIRENILLQSEGSIQLHGDSNIRPYHFIITE